MNRGILLVCAVALVTACGRESAPVPDRAADEALLQEIVVGLTEAWRAGDAAQWASYFAEDADFTVWFGLRMKGREEIAFGHDIIFNAFYANTAFELDVADLSFTTDDVVIGLLEGRVTRNGVAGGLEPDAVPMVVFRRSGDSWEIVAFQNTPSAVAELRVNGDLARFKAWARGVAEEPGPGG